MNIFKEHPIVMLPTEKASQLSVQANGVMKLGAVGIGIYQHLYILSDEEIKGGDWVINTKRNELFQAINSTQVKYANKFKEDYKVSATTDNSLKVITSKTGYTISKGPLFTIKENLPQISQQFIEHYIAEYNKDNVITEVELGYEQLSFNDSDKSILDENNLVTIQYKLKTTADNKVVIKLIQEKFFTRKDIMNALHKVELEHNKNYTKIWDGINKNLK